MKRQQTIAALFALIAASACASTQQQQRYALVPVQSNGTDLPGLDSGTILESRQPGGIVSVRADDQFASFGAGFIVAVHNKSGGPLDFGPTNIEVLVNGQKLPILAANELDAKVKAEARGYLRATSRTGEVDIEAATAEVAREYRFNNYGGHAAGTQSLAYTDDQGAGYRQDRIARELQAKTIAEAAAKLQTNQALISQKALRPALVAPEQMSGGVIVVEPPKNGGKVDLTVTFNGQKHRFVFTATPAA
jgi:hypothetical protein